MRCEILYALYGRDTRPAQVLNVLTSTLWLFAILSQFHGIVLVQLPTLVLSQWALIGTICSVAIIFGLAGFITKGKQHQIFKSFGLLVGSVVQLIFANSYVSAYPPLDMMLFVSTGLGLWFLFAVYYVTRCEGLNGSVPND